jgi:hypothetical protein
MIKRIRMSPSYFHERAEDTDTIGQQDTKLS